MAINIITISREFGSGGRTIGKALAEKLGIPCYDSEIIEKVAEKSGFDKEYIADKGEYVRKSHLTGIFRSNYYYKSSDEDIIRDIQTKLILEIAEKESCVIVGRCADYILKDRDDILKVFICSDKESRAKRIVEVYGEKDESPEKRIRDKDKRRASYYQFYTDMKWGDAANYDICLNSAKLGFENCADILYKIVMQEKEAE